METTTTLPPTLVEQAGQVAQQVATPIKDMAQQMLMWLQSGEKFILEQAPDIARQLIQWRLAETIIYMIIGALLLIVALKSFLYAVKWSLEEEGKFDSEGQYFVGVVSWVSAALLSFFGILFFFINLMSFAQAYFAPKIYLIEYFSSLVRNR